MKHCCSKNKQNTEATDPHVNVNVNVDVNRIVRSCCITGIFIVSIIFAPKLIKEVTKTLDC